MSNHDNALLPRRLTPAATAVRAPRRINVAVTPAMMSAIDRVIDNEQVTLTEALRRLIAYGNLVYDVTKVRNAKLVIRDLEGGEREVVVLL